LITKNDPKTIRAWTFYDWANSSFPLVINSAIFPTFYEAVTRAKTKTDCNDTSVDYITAFGTQFVNTEFYSYCVSLALIIVAIIAPVLSGIADYSGHKKKFLSAFCILGASATCCLAFFNAESVALSMFPFVLATIGFWSSLVFYNAYLPQIATTDHQDRVSAKGFSMGYLGSSILLIINLALIVPKIMPAQYSFITVGVWWLFFGQMALRKLPGKQDDHKNEGKMFTKGFQELKKVFLELKGQVKLKRFLISYFFYNMGVQTVMYMATLFASREIVWPDCDKKRTSLIVSILLIQFLGIAGAFLFSFISKKIGNIKTLGIAIFAWIGICAYVFLYVRTPFEFYLTAASVGLVMGGIQAMSRSTYSKFLPETKDHTSYFSFYDVMEKIGIVLGVFAFGFINGQTGSMRKSVLALISFFILGFIFLLFIPKEKKQ
jgi:MFS transporter, UMF1 family